MKILYRKDTKAYKFYEIGKILDSKDTKGSKNENSR